VLDPGSRQVFASGKPVELTTFEFDILEMLIALRRARAFPRRADGEFL